MNKTENKGSGRRVPDSISEFFAHIRKKIRSSVKRGLLALKNSRLLRKILEPESIEAITKAAKCSGLCAISFLFGRCNFGFGVYPLGLSMLICSGKLTFFSYMGSAIAALTYSENGFAFFGVNTLVYIIRKLLLSDGFSESRRLRTFLALGTGVFISAALFVTGASGGNVGTDSNLIFSALTYTVTLPLSVYLLYPVVASESFGVSAVHSALTVFCMFTVMSANFTLPIGSHIAIFLACALTLFFCAKFEQGFALCSSALLGFSTLNFSFAAPLCISAFVFTRLYSKKPYLAYPAFASVCSLLCLIVFDFSAISAYIFLDILLGTMFFIPAGIILSSKYEKCTDTSAPAREAVGEAYNRRMTSLSGAFNSVSKLCFGFSNRLKFPSPDEAAVLITIASAKICGSCNLSATCKYKRLYGSPELSTNLVSGKLTVGKLPEKLKHVCPNAGRIVEEINDEYRRVLTDRFNNNKTEILAYEYSTLARILKYTSRLSSEDVYYDAPLTRTAIAATKKLGLPNTGVTVYGSRKKVLDVNGVPVSAVSTPSENMAKFYSAECGVLFDIPEFILDENSTFTMRFKSKEMIAVEYVKVSHTKSGEVVSGDTVSFFRSDDSFFYALIADGMGSGRDAAMTSRITSVFVEKLLSGGAGKGVTMELLNSMLMSKSKECFSTVDLLELDLIKRRASFVKAGAAPAYLLRSAKLFKVSSDTPPCGIVEGFSAENTSFEVFSGDVIIMLSDGITSSIDCGNALCDIMNEHKSSPAEVIANKILDTAVSLSVHDDDMSCVLVRIK